MKKLFALLLILILLTSCSSIPQLTEQIYNNTSGSNSSIKIKYPAFSDTKKYEFINVIIEDLAKKGFTDDKINENYNGDYHVTYNQNGWFSVILKGTHTFKEENKNIEIMRSVNYDIKNKSTFVLSDIYNINENFCNAFTYFFVKNFNNDKSEQEIIEEYFGETGLIKTLETLNQNSENCFYFDDENIYICTRNPNGLTYKVTAISKVEVAHTQKEAKVF